MRQVLIFIQMFDYYHIKTHNTSVILPLKHREIILAYFAGCGF
jgi:hypothetical protein